MNMEQQELKQSVLSSRFSRMNDMQKKAVFQVNGPVLILAGAGSGKTTVLVNRIANLLAFGNAYHDDTPLSDEAVDFLKKATQGTEGTAPAIEEHKLRELLCVNTVNPWNILAITFTNKAAGELKSRLFALLGDEGLQVSAGTFHSICLKILRREISALGYNSNFTIYDTDDSIRLLRDCENELQIDEKMFPHKMVLHEISRAKDSLITPEQYKADIGDGDGEDFRKKVLGNLYALYQKRLKEYNAVDFDDIICLTVKLLESDKEVLSHYQNLYKYVLVDEYQDTNHAQYRLVRLLSQKTSNICVVGDDDQSIYKFRGATIENILNFEKDFDNATVIRLEQNYRSTQNILDAANALISHNSARKGKNLWTDIGDGEKVTSYRCTDENSESQFVINKINEHVEAGAKFSDNVVLYRMNAQSANIERILVKSGIPYRIVGGTKFYERKEIKDVMSYLHILENTNDAVRLKRIINEPKRGIGDATVKSVETIAASLGISMFQVLKNSQGYESISKKSSALIGFANMIEALTELSHTATLPELLDELMDKTDYHAYLKAQGREGEGRLENIEELKSNLIHYEEENKNSEQGATLGGFLEEISLYTDLDSMNDADDKVTLMTMHGAKGLEFKFVFIVGMEENIFPSYLSSNSEEELEEERRLAYVAVTRAKEHLYITNSAQRMLFGRTSRNMPSRFLREIPEELTEIVDETTRAYGYPAARAEKVKAVYKPEIEGTVGVSRPALKAVINFKSGDKVQHAVFGVGVVKAMTPMSNDVLVEIAFEKAGVKRIMANFAKLTKI